VNNPIYILYAPEGGKKTIIVIKKIPSLPPQNDYPIEGFV
jgi:hypothetical protein